MSKRIWLTSGLAAIALMVLAAPGTAEEEEEGERHSKLSIHGFLTQAYGRSYDNQYLGMPVDSGTTDLRKAALQFRYDATPRDVVVIQLQHQRWGRTPVAELLDDDISLDWAFYQHTFNNDLWVRAGKVTIPFGIFNQVRDVGTILPFYRIPFSVYRDGALQIETVDGFAAGKTFSLGNVDLETAAYFGETRLDAQGGFGADMRNMTGGQVALAAFDSRLRASVSYYQADGVNDFAPTVKEDWRAPVYSLEAHFGRVRVIGEYVGYKHPPVKTPGWYVMASVAATDKLTITGMYQKDDFEFGGFPIEVFEKDKAVALAWAFRPDLVLRLEHHIYKGYGAEFPDDPPTGPGPYKADNSILSLSASF